MKEMPDIPDILLTVRDFLKDLAPTLQPGAKFEAQVAIYLLDIARREIALVNAVEDASAGEAVKQLCDRIRSGAHDADWDKTVTAVLDDTIARVCIVRPAYLVADHAERSLS